MERRESNCMSATCQQGIPIGEMGNFESLRHVHIPVVDRSIGRSCVSESRGKHVSNLPIGAMGNLQGLCVARTHCIVDRSVRSCAIVSWGKHVSNYPIGVMGTLQGLGGTHILLLTEAFAGVQA
jgi:hypothetical protein